MKNRGIEDIYIGADMKNEKKSKKGIIIVIFIILLLVLAGCVGAFFYLKNSKLTPKQSFINGMAGTNIKSFMSNDIYSDMLKRIEEENSNSETKMTFSTTNEVQDIDVSNLELNIKNSNDIDKKKSFSEFALNYSGNEMFNVKLALTDKEAAVMSNDIVTKYVGIHYDKIKDIFGIDFNKDEIDNLSKISKIDMSQEDTEKYESKYMEEIFKQIPDEKFSSQENIVVEKKSGQVNVTAYTLDLSVDDLKGVLSNTLTTLKNDEELLGKLVTGKSSNSSDDSTNTTSNSPIISSDDDNSNENTETTDVPVIEPNNSTINIHDQTDSSTDTVTAEEGTESNFNSGLKIATSDIQITSEDNVDVYNTVSENNDSEITTTSVNDDLPGFRTVDTTSNDENEDSTSTTMNLDINSDDSNIDSDATFITPKESNDLEDIEIDLVQILCGIKIEKSVSELQSDIDKLIQKVNKLNGDNGITIKVCVNEDGKAEKIFTTLPDGFKFDLEFTTNSEKDNSIYVIYTTQKAENDTSSSNTDESTNGIVTYSASTDNSITNETNSDSVTDENGSGQYGFELSLNKVDNDSNTNLGIVYKNIVNDAYNTEISIDIKTNKVSNGFDNDVVINLKDDENALKVLVDNSMKFENDTEIEDLTSDNCVFLDELSEEERNQTMEAIIDKIKSVYQDKLGNLNFIDTNTGTTSGDLSNISTSVSKEDAKNALIDKFKELYNKAQENGEEFSLHNLENLKIDGYNVSTNITDDVAIIVVDTYTFKINSSFELSED